MTDSQKQMYLDGIGGQSTERVIETGDAKTEEEAMAEAQRAIAAFKR